MNDDFREIFEGLTLENWPERKVKLFDAFVAAGLGPVEVDKILGSVAKALRVTKKAITAEWQAHLGPLPSNDDASTRAVGLVLEAGVELWHAPDRQAWISIPKDDHLEHHPVRSREVRAWVAGLYYSRTGKSLYNQALVDTLGLLESRGLYDGQEHRVFTRLAEHEGKVYLDLTRHDWQQVEVSSDGWRVIPSSGSPVRFRRSPHQKPLPIPQKGTGGLDEVLSLLPLRSRNDVVLVLGWLIGALNPRGPYPVVVVLGEKGAGKSYLTRILKTLIDPTEAPLRAEPRDVEALMVAAANNQVVVFDNLSKIPPWFSDAVCRLATGGGLSKRQLYTDADEYVLDAIRPVALTGIALGVLRDDLADRSVPIYLQRIEDSERIPERELRDRFERLHAPALGQLLDGVSQALRDWQSTRAGLESLPRMADWCVWAEAAAPALGLARGEITQAFYQVQSALEQDFLESDLVAQAILALTADWPPGEVREFATAALLEALIEAAGLTEAKVRPEGWPRTPQGLGKHLPRVQTALRGVGVSVRGVRDPHTKSSRWVLENTGIQYPQYPQTPQTPTSTVKTPAGIASAENTQTPQYPQTQTTSAGIAGIEPQTPQQIPQEKTPSKTGSAGIAGIAGIEYTQILNKNNAAKPQGLFSEAMRYLSEAEDGDEDDDDSIYI